MEVIFDTNMLRPVLSPTMKTALSVISLIGRSLVEANKCMKERVAAEAGQPSTLDEVMKQSGLNIPGLEEALAQFMGGGDDARKVASMVANTPDPVTLLNRFAASFGVGPRDGAVADRHATARVRGQRCAAGQRGPGRAPRRVPGRLHP
jgi:hypothetical protein